MKALSIALALATVGVLVGHLWLGPLYTIDGGCACGSRCEWKEFSDCAPLHGKVFGLRVTRAGDAGHKHKYEPMQYGQSGRWVEFVVFGLGAATIVVELRRRGLAPSASMLSTLIAAYCMATPGANPAHALDSGIASLLNVGHHWPAASDEHRWASKHDRQHI
jgi:hypothetical protein